MANQLKLIKDRDAILILSCSRATFWRRVADGAIARPLKIGGLSRWKLSDIEDPIVAADEFRR